jgi:hypothetical protein
MLSRQTTKSLALVISTAAMIITSAAHAGLMGVKSIEIYSANAGSDPLGYLQIAEVVAIETGSGNDLALSSAGAIAAGSAWVGGPGNPGGDFGDGTIGVNGNSPNKAIDGISGAQPFPEIFHSKTYFSGELLRITFAASAELDSVSVFGRSGCCTDRDLFEMALLDEQGQVLFEARVDSRSGQEGFADLSRASNVPAPAPLGLLAAGLLGLAALQRRQ